MKKTLVFLLLNTALLAFDSMTASKIFDKIFSALIPKENICVYTLSPMYTEVIENASSLSLCTKLKKADIILVDSFDEVPKGSEKMVLFATSYRVYKKEKSAVGAFYWDRGHVKIKFSQQRLNDKNITLPKAFNKYIMDEL